MRKIMDPEVPLEEDPDRIVSSSKEGSLFARSQLSRKPRNVSARGTRGPIKSFNT
jgi:hypothetical protein